MDGPPPPTTTYDRLENELDAAGADAFLHVGDRFDDDLRYLTRFSGPDRPYGFVYAAETAHLCAPRLFADQAEREFPGQVVLAAADQSGGDPAERALDALSEHVDPPSATVLVLPSISIDVYRTVAGALAEVTVADVDLGRATKAAAERQCHAFVQGAAEAGMARAETILAAADVVDGDGGEASLRWDGETLTTETLRREVNAVLSSAGVRDAGNSVIGAGESCADLHFTGRDVVRPDETVLFDLSPRGPHGYYADLTRTFVVGEVREWERRAYEAVVAAQDAALETLEAGAGIPARGAHDAATEILAEYGFESGEVDVGMTHGTGHGVGLSLHEGPSLSTDEQLEAGHVVTVEPGVYDPDRGGVRLEDLVVITSDGYENLTAYPREKRPASDRTP